MCAAPALLGGVVMRAANLTEWSGAGIGVAAENRGRYVPVLAALVQAGVFGWCREVDVGCMLLVLLLLRWRGRRVDVTCRRLVLILLLVLDRCGCEVGAV